MIPATNNSPGEWVTEGTQFVPEQVGDFVPAQFPAYARLFHTIDQGNPALTWRSIAATSSVAVTPAMQWQLISQHALTGSHGPRKGSLTTSEAAALSDALTRFTSTPQHCYYGFWEGWASAGNPLDLPTFDIGTRTMLLFEGTSHDASHPFQYPANRIANVWWPADHAWFIVTEIDFDSTIIAGTEDCIETLLTLDSLEIMEISADDSLSFPQP